jgi:hypothetical protein
MLVKGASTHARDQDFGTIPSFWGDREEQNLSKGRRNRPTHFEPGCGFIHQKWPNLGVFFGSFRLTCAARVLTGRRRGERETTAPIGDSRGNAVAGKMTGKFWSRFAT